MSTPEDRRCGESFASGTAQVAKQRTTVGVGPPFERPEGLHGGLAFGSAAAVVGALSVAGGFSRATAAASTISGEPGRRRVAMFLSSQAAARSLTGRRRRLARWIAGGL